MTDNTVTLRTMTEAEYREATRLREAEATRELAELVPEEVAAERVRQGTATFLPAGRETDGHHLVVAENRDGTVVGRAWIGPDPQSVTGTTDSAWLYDIAVHEPYRRQGYGAAILAAAEELIAAAGYTRLGLNVVGDNEAAIALYRRSGYAVSSMTMHKPLGRP